MPAYLLSHFSGVQLFVTSWTVAHQVPLSMKFPRQEYWSGLPFPPPGNLPDPGIEPGSLTSFASAGRSFTTSAACFFSPLLRLALFFLLSHCPAFSLSLVFVCKKKCFTM